MLGTGPTAEFDAMPACFSELIHSAREELVVTTPYFVPDEQLLFALTSAARRRVRTIMLFPKRNDNWIVAGASRSYYKDLIDAGAEIYEYPAAGCSTPKRWWSTAEVGLIGSANLDRRSFELNFENNILFEDARLRRRSPRHGRTNISRNAIRSLATTSTAIGIGAAPLAEPPRDAQPDAADAPLVSRRFLPA